MFKKSFTHLKNQHWLIQLGLLAGLITLFKHSFFNIESHLGVVLTFTGGLIIGLFATFLFSQRVIKQNQSNEWQKQQESLKNIQQLIDDLSKKQPITNTKTSTITKEAPPLTPVPHCAIVMQGPTLQGYVIPYTIEGENVCQSNSKQGLAFRNALRVLKQQGHTFNILKPKGSLGNYISKGLNQNTKFDPSSQLEFPVNLMSNN